jgi:hypothetical protein
MSDFETSRREPLFGGKAPIYYEEDEYSSSLSPEPIRVTPLMEVSNEKTQRSQSFRRSPTPIREQEQKVKPFQFPIGIFLLVAVASAGILTAGKTMGLPEYSIDEISAFMSPDRVWPLICFVGVLILTLEVAYFPTAGMIIAYAALMARQYEFYPTALQTAGGIAAYCTVAAIWFFIKFWSFLRDSNREDEIKGISPGQEGSYLRKYASYLYLHVLYWPLSMPYTIYTRILYQLYIMALERGSGVFSKMIAKRRDQLQKQ